jgi:hypothetical protein
MPIGGNFALQGYAGERDNPLTNYGRILLPAVTSDAQVSNATDDYGAGNYNLFPTLEPPTVDISSTITELDPTATPETLQFVSPEPPPAETPPAEAETTEEAGAIAA